MPSIKQGNHVCLQTTYTMKKRLNKKQFSQAAALHGRMSADTKKMAQLVLVNRMRITDVADQYDVQEQAVNRAVSAIYKTYITEIKKCPADWVTVELCAPEKKVKQWAEEAKAAKYGLKIKRK